MAHQQSAPTRRIYKYIWQGQLRGDRSLPRTLPERLSDYPEVEYADTAFDGNMESVEIRPTAHGPAGCAVLSNQSRCHEYLAIDTYVHSLSQHKKNHFEIASIGQALFDSKEEQCDIPKEPASLKFYNIGFPPSIVGQIIMVGAGYIAFITFFVSILAFIIMAFDEWTSWSQELKEAAPAVLLYFGLPFSIFIIFKFLNSNELLTRFNPTPKIRLALRRDTGMVEFRKKGKFIAVPFSEVMGMTRTIMDQNGVRRLFFILNHKHSPLSQNLDNGWGGLAAYTEQERWIYHLRWELYQHYMDITRPLPDIPEFEPYRHLDPTTREWDRQHNRPKDYWLSMEQDTYKAMVDESCNKAQAYPFDAPETAQERGWTPAGDGKAWYQLG